METDREDLLQHVQVSYATEGEQEMETDEEVFFQQESSDQPAKEESTNPVQKLVVTAVLDGLKINSDSGISIGTFEDILEYAKKLLLSTHDNKAVDRDILITLWAKTWNDVQYMLKKEGYDRAKQYYICICCQQKAVDANSGTPKYSYSGKHFGRQG